MTSAVEMAKAVTIEDVYAARERIAPYLDASPLFASRTMSGMAGCELRFKAENFCRTGSFKPHGAFNAVLQLTPEERQRGVATASAGNHGQALALAAATAGAPCTIFMAEGSVQAKVDAIRGYGATIDFSPDFPTAFARLTTFGEAGHATVIHPFANADVVAGQGVVGLEILEDVPNVEQIVVPIGGGGLISGVALAAKSANPAIRVVGVEPVGAPSVHAALEQNQVVTLPDLNTIADGLAAPFTSELNLAMIHEYVDDVVLVTDDEILAAMRLIMERLKIVCEPSGAASLAAILTNKAAIPTGAVTVAIISGGNIDSVRLKALL